MYIRPLISHVFRVHGNLGVSVPSQVVCRQLGYNATAGALAVPAGEGMQLGVSKPIAREPSDHGLPVATLALTKKYQNAKKYSKKTG